MTVDSIKNIIAGLRTATPVSMDLVSKPSNMRKTGNPYPNAMKHVTLSGMVGMDYSNGVNNQLGREDKEADFVAQKPSWMVHDGRNLGTNKAGTRSYVPIKVQASSKPVYMADGVDVTADVAPYIRKSEAPKTQDNLDKKVIWRTPALDSIQTIRMLGAEMKVEG